MKNIMDSLLGLYDMMEKDFGEERKKKYILKYWGS